MEALEEFVVSHSATVASGSWTGAFSLSEDVTVRVYDDDTAGVLLSASALYVDEDTTTTYTIELMGSPSDNVEVRFAFRRCRTHHVPCDEAFRCLFSSAETTFAIPRYLDHAREKCIDEIFFTISYSYRVCIFLFRLGYEEKLELPWERNSARKKKVYTF